MTQSLFAPRSSAPPAKSVPEVSDPLRWLDQVEASLNELRVAIETSQTHQQEARPLETPSQHSADDNNEASPLRIVLLDHRDSLARSLPDLHADELEVAVARRDQYISYLCDSIREIAVRIEAWLRLLSEQSSDAAEANESNLNPDSPTVAVVKDAESCVQQIVTAMQIEHSISRAELARERAQLEADREALQRERELLLESGQLSEVPAETPIMQRWRRFLAPAERKH